MFAIDIVILAAGMVAIALISIGGLIVIDYSKSSTERSRHWRIRRIHVVGLGICQLLSGVLMVVLLLSIRRLICSAA